MSGTTYLIELKSLGPQDTGAGSTPASVTINQDPPFTTKQNGVTLHAFDLTNGILTKQIVCNTSTDSPGPLILYLDNLLAGSIIVGVTYGEVSTQLGTANATFLQVLGVDVSGLGAGGKFAFAALSGANGSTKDAIVCLPPAANTTPADLIVQVKKDSTGVKLVKISSKP
jgi:hypothetical protein